MAKLTVSGFEGKSLLPYAPVGNVTESFEFNTDVFTSYNGSEQREANLVTARYNLKYALKRSLLGRQEVFNDIEQNIRGEWVVPMWSEVQYLGHIGTGTYIPCDSARSQFIAGQLALLYTKANEWQVRKISIVNPNGITLEDGFDAADDAFLMPANNALLMGKVGYTIGSAGSQFTFDYSVRTQRVYPTRIGVMFLVDHSASMAGSVLAWTKANLSNILNELRGCIANSGVIVDLAITSWAASVTTSVWELATVADIDAALAVVAALTATGSTTPDPNDAFTEALTFFGTTSPHRFGRTDFLFYITNSGRSTVSAAATVAAMLSGASPYNGTRAVSMYSIVFDTGSGHDTTQALRMDNASDGVLTVMTPDDAVALTTLFNRVLAHDIGVQYAGYEILTTEPDDDMMSKQVDQPSDMIDFDGVFDVRTTYAQSRVGTIHRFLFDSVDEVYNLKRFIYRRQGRCRPFYMPSFQHDLQLRDLNGDRDQAYVDHIDFDAFTQDRRTVVIQYLDGTWQGNSIDTATSVLSGYRLTFTAPLLKTLDQIAQVCYMGLARLDTDRIDINWVGYKVATSALNILEIQK